MLSPRPLFAGDSFFRRMNTRLRPSQLRPGELALSKNGRIDEDGSWRCRDGYQNVSGATLTTTDSVIIRDEDEDGAIILFADISIVSASIASNSLKIAFAGPHGFPIGQSFLFNIDGVAFTTTDPNGNRVMSVLNSTQLSATLTAPNETYTITSGEVARSAVLSSDVVAIYGACKFSDPSSSGDEYFIVADNAKATAIKVSDTSDTTEISYPASQTLSQEVDLRQELDTVVLRQDGKTAWEWDGDLSGSPAFSAVASGTKTQHSIFDTTNNTAISGPARPLTYE